MDNYFATQKYYLTLTLHDRNRWHRTWVDTCVHTWLFWWCYLLEYWISRQIDCIFMEYTCSIKKRYHNTATHSVCFLVVSMCCCACMRMNMLHKHCRSLQHAYSVSGRLIVVHSSHVVNHRMMQHVVCEPRIDFDLRIRWLSVNSTAMLLSCIITMDYNPFDHISRNVISTADWKNIKSAQL